MMQWLDSRTLDSFRPLSGKWGYRSGAVPSIARCPVTSLFPSPLGEMGLSITRTYALKKLMMLVSVPSRGNGVIDQPKKGRTQSEGTVSVPSRGNGVIDRSIETELKERKNEVSVPSRGNGVIDLLRALIIITLSRPGFRPLSGKWGYRFT